VAAPSQTLALPWYARNDCPVLLRLFSDPNKLPTTYDTWLERAEGSNGHFRVPVSICQNMDSSHRLCGLARGTERFSRSSRAADYRK